MQHNCFAELTVQDFHNVLVLVSFSDAFEKSEKLFFQTGLGIRLINTCLILICTLSFKDGCVKYFNIEASAMVTRPPFTGRRTFNTVATQTAAAKCLKLFTNSSVFIYTINSDGNKTRTFKCSSYHPYCLVLYAKQQL